MGGNRIVKQLERHCPICACSEGEVLHHQRFKLPGGVALPEAYDLVACSGCGFVFADTPASQAAYSRYYTDFSKYEEADSTISSGGGSSRWDRERLEQTALAIQQHCKQKNARILDVGCANGGLLAILQQAGFSGLSGLDPSAACASQVRQRLGIPCELGDLLEPGELRESARFDLIILSHVLEHICDLQRAVASASRLLEAGGVVYAETPDAAGYCESFVVPYYYFDVEHINHFDSCSLGNLFGWHGFEPLQIASKTFQVNESIHYPAVFGIFNKSGAHQPLRSGGAARQAVLRYVELSRSSSAEATLERLAQAGQAIAVFGAGNFTARLLETTALSRCNIAFYVDNDRKKQGGSFDDIPVETPEALRGFSGPVLVCAALFSEQIVAQLKEELRIDNEIVVIR